MPLLGFTEPLKLRTFLPQYWSSQRGKTWEIVVTLTEPISWHDTDLPSASTSSLFAAKAGLLGIAMAAVSFLIFESTSNMDGLSAGFSWTHSSATCMHRVSLHEEHASSSDGSMNSMLLPSFHSSYAWSNLMLISKPCCRAYTEFEIKMKWGKSQSNLHIQEGVNFDPNHRNMCSSCHW